MPRGHSSKNLADINNIFPDCRAERSDLAPLGGTLKDGHCDPEIQRLRDEITAADGVGGHPSELAGAMARNFFKGWFVSLI